MSHAEPVFTLAELEEQEKLAFPSFDGIAAYELGTIAAEVIREWDLKLAVDIVLDGSLVYRAKLNNTAADAERWLSRKAASAVEFGASSLLLRFRHDAEGTSFTDRDIDHDVYAGYGGAFPIRVDGKIVGTITSSGEPDVVDHEAVVEAIRRYLAR